MLRVIFFIQPVRNVFPLYLYTKTRYWRLKHFFNAYNMRDGRFTTECHLETDGEVTCFGCPEGYTGRRCQRCDVGYEGDPTTPGGTCRFTGHSPVHSPDPELRETAVTGLGKIRGSFFSSIGYYVSVAHWHSARWAWNGYQSGLGSIPRPGRINCFTIIGVHALRLISRTGQRVWRCPL